MRRILTLALAALLAIALLAAPVSAKGDKAPAGDTIAEITDGSGFSTLNFALRATGLYDVLDGKGQYTVFAPTDAAFAALENANPGTIAYLVDNPDVLTEVLLYHVTDGRRWSNSVFNANNSKAIKMLNGGYVWANPGLSLADNDSLSLGSPDAGIESPNINASNGVVHVINQVLIP
jgi:uncharacterized surface protein with fasciclin (FAS1) repeats